MLTVVGYDGAGGYQLRRLLKGPNDSLITKHYSELCIPDPRFAETEAQPKKEWPAEVLAPGYVLRAVTGDHMNSNLRDATGLPKGLKEKVARQGGVRVSRFPGGGGFRQVSFRPQNQLVHLQAKVAVAALASFFGQSKDWKWLLLLGGLFAANLLLFRTAWRSPPTDHPKVNLFHMTCLSVCLMTNLVGIFANLAGTAALLSWLLGLLGCAVAGALFTNPVRRAACVARLTRLARKQQECCRCLRRGARGGEGGGRRASHQQDSLSELLVDFEYAP